MHLLSDISDTESVLKRKFRMLLRNHDPPKLISSTLLSCQVSFNTVFKEKLGCLSNVSEISTLQNWFSLPSDNDQVFLHTDIFKNFGRLSCILQLPGVRPCRFQRKVKRPITVLRNDHRATVSLLSQLPEVPPYKLQGKLRRPIMVLRNCHAPNFSLVFSVARCSSLQASMKS